MKVEKNENGHYRGLHIVLINSEDGKVEMAKVFDTYQSSDEIARFITDDIPEGTIVAAACQDDCISKMAWGVK